MSVELLLEMPPRESSHSADNRGGRRWESQLALGGRLEDLDREGLLRMPATAVEQRRLLAGTIVDVGDTVVGVSAPSCCGGPRRRVAAPLASGEVEGDG
ncbi:MAG: hypothetical protein IT379_42835 [Deltaproteobacteria bacterium]|nr:hypothetical protein [Deltaproteobacteria bacterium]